MTTKIELANGYQATIAQDIHAENPFTAWDCQAPTSAYFVGGRRIEDYGDGPDLADLFRHLPPALFETPEGIAQVLSACHVSNAELVELLEEWGTSEGQAPDYAEAIGELLPAPPYHWGEAVEYFDALEATTRLAGLACHLTQSQGYSQGDCALVFSVATPEYLEVSGVKPEDATETCKDACKLWGAWAWGDIYGVESIVREDGTEVLGGSCWGYYGDDHEESGLMDHCRAMIVFDMEELEMEAAAAHEAACRDIFTA